jgi:hypothetical protein
MTVPAGEVRVHADDRNGDSLPGLDNGYVVEVEPREFGYVRITFHTAEGDEAYLNVPGDMPVTVKREG